jgi:hypothetical protein
MLKVMHSTKRFACGFLLLASLAAVFAATGCQMPGGNTSASGYHVHGADGYYPSDPNFKLSREAAAQKQYADEQARQSQQTQLAGAQQFGTPSPFAAQAQYTQQATAGGR